MKKFLNKINGWYFLLALFITNCLKFIIIDLIQSEVSSNKFMLASLSFPVVGVLLFFAYHRFKRIYENFITHYLVYAVATFYTFFISGIEEYNNSSDECLGEWGNNFCTIVQIGAILGFTVFVYNCILIFRKSIK